MERKEVHTSPAGTAKQFLAELLLPPPNPLPMPDVALSTQLMLLLCFGVPSMGKPWWLLSLLECRICGGGRRFQNPY